MKRGFLMVISALCAVIGCSKSADDQQSEYRCVGLEDIVLISPEYQTEKDAFITECSDCMSRSAGIVSDYKLYQELAVLCADWCGRGMRGEVSLQKKMSGRWTEIVWFPLTYEGSYRGRNVNERWTASGLYELDCDDSEQLRYFIESTEAVISEHAASGSDGLPDMIAAIGENCAAYDSKYVSGTFNLVKADIYADEYERICSWTLKSKK